MNKQRFEQLQKEFETCMKMLDRCDAEITKSAKKHGKSSAKHAQKVSMYVLVSLEVYARLTKIKEELNEEKARI